MGHPAIEQLPTDTEVNDYLPLIPTEGAPAATAANAYSICTSFPDGLRREKQFPHNQAESY